MKSIVKEALGEGNVALVERAEPVSGKNEVKIKVMAVGICGTDIKIKHGQSWCNPPVILGHELSGQIVEIGEDVTSVKVGDRVVCETAQVICKNCYYCKSGNYLMCKDRLSIGYGVDGGMAEYCVVREDIIHQLPDNVDYENGALCEPAAVSVHAVYDAVRLLSTDVVLVSGTGAIGLLVAQIAKSFGTTVIITGLDIDEKRLAVARELGIDYTVNVQKEDLASVVNDITGGFGVDVAYECSGSLSGVRSVMSLLKKMGKLVQIGLTKHNLEIEYSLLTAREISLIGTFGHKWTSWETALKLIEQGKIRTAPLITHNFSIDNWEEAFAVAEHHEGIKIIIYPNV